MMVNITINSPGVSEFKVNSALFQYGICSVTRFNLCINRHMALGNGAVPDIVVTFTAPLERTAIFG